jgi:hypothetical protein
MPTKNGNKCGATNVSGPLFKYKGFEVVVGELKDDLPHYLVLNAKTNVIEGSSHKLVEARLYTCALADETEKQDLLLLEGKSLREPDDGRARAAFN